MTDAGQSGSQPPAMVFWVIWFSFFSGMFLILQFAGGGWPAGEGAGFDFGHPMVWIPLVPWFISQIVRWGVIPRLSRPETQFPAAIVGMGLAEGTMMLSLFLLPGDQVLAKQVYIVAAILGVLVFAPTYFGKTADRRKDGFGEGNYLK